MPKRSIRQTLLMQRRLLSEQQLLLDSAKVQKKLLATETYRKASVLALYAPIHNEVGTEKILQSALGRGKTVCYPRVKGRGLDFVSVAGPDELSPGVFGIAEPSGRDVVDISGIDLIVLPGIAFDRKGYRLGYGGGYYDRAIGVSCSAELIGFAHDFQLVDELPIEEHDIRIDRIVTSSEMLVFEKDI